MPIQPFDTEINLGGFSTAAGVATLNGSITGLTVKEDDGTKTYNIDTNNILRVDRDWRITLNWRLFGTLLDLTPPAMGMITAELHGRFKVMAYFEGIGLNADEKDLPGDKTNLGGIDLMAGKTGTAAMGSRIAANPAAIPPVAADPEATEWQYEETFTIQAEDLTLAPPRNRYLKAGSYRVSVNLTFEQPATWDADGNPLTYKPGPMAGFMELPGMVQVYDPGTP